MSRDGEPALSKLGLAGLLFLVTWVAFTANCRLIATADTICTGLAPFAFWRGDGFVLDGVLDESVHGDLYCVTAGLGGERRNAYPVGLTLAVAPFYAPLLALPDLETARLPLAELARVVEKYVAATVAALAVVALFDLLLLFTDRSRAALLALAFGLATPIWAVASQSYFQHGPAVLVFVLALRLLLARAPKPGLSALAGGLAALVVAIRPPDGLLALALALVALRRPGRSVRLPFALAMAAGGTALVVYNVTTFGALTGGYSKFVAPPLSFSFAALGNLLVGNRGLLFFAPFLALFDYSRRPGDPLDAGDRGLLAVAWLGTLAFYASFPVFWGGENYGSRYLIDGLPILFVLAAHSLERPARSLRVLGIAAGAIFAVAVQAVGAFGFPGGASGLASNHPPQLVGLRRSTPFLALQALPMPPQLAPLALRGAQRPLPEGARAEVEWLAPPPLRWPARGRYPLWFRVVNRSEAALPAWGTFGGDFAVQPVVIWQRLGSESLIPEEFSLGRDLAPGESRDYQRQVLAPEERATYQLRVMLVEQSGGYRQLGASPARRVTVIAADEEPWVRSTQEIVHFSDFETGDASDWDTQESEPAPGEAAPEDPGP